MRSLETLIWDLVVFDEAHNLAGRSDRSTAAGAIGNRARALVLAHSHAALWRRRGVRSAVQARTSRIEQTRSSCSGARGPMSASLTPGETRCCASGRRSQKSTMHDALMAYARLVWSRSRDAAGAGAQLAMSVLTRRACSSAASLVRSVERRLELLGQPGAMPDASAGLPFVDDGHRRRRACRVASTPRTPRRTRGAEPSPAAARPRPRRGDGGKQARGPAAPDLQSPNEPVIVFTEYRDTLRELSATLCRRRDASQLHGGLTARERKRRPPSFHRRHGASTPGHRRRQRRVEPAPALPTRDQSRAAMDPLAPGATGRTRRSDRPSRTRSTSSEFAAKGTCEETTLVRLERRIARIQDAMQLDQLDPERASCRRVDPRRRTDPPRRTRGQAPDRSESQRSISDTRPSRRQRVSPPLAALLDADPPCADRQPSGDRQPPSSSARPAPRCVWVFGVTVSSGSGEVVCEPLVVLTAELRHGGRLRRDIQRCLTQMLRRSAGAPVAQHRILLELRDTLRRPVALWTRREQDLMAELRDRHARMSRPDSCSVRSSTIAMNV